MPHAAVHPVLRAGARMFTGRTAAGALTAGLAAGVAELALPVVVGLAVGRIGAGGSALPALVPVIVALVAVGVLGGLRTWAMASVAAREMAGIRLSVLSHLAHLPAPDLERAGHGELVGRFDSDVDAVEKLFTRARISLALAGFTALFAVVIMAWTSLWLLLTVIGCLAVFAAVLAVMLRPVKPATTVGLAATVALVDELTDVLRYPRTVKVYGLEGRYTGRFRHQVDVIRRVETRLGRLQAGADTLTRLAVHGSALVAVGVGAAMIGSGSLTWARLSVFLVAMTVLAPPVVQVTQLLHDRQQALAAGARLADLLSIEPEHVAPRVDGRQERVPRLDCGRAAREPLRFDDIGVRLDDAWVVRGISFEAAPGEVVCLAGASGAGKSVLLSLVPRLLDPTEGEVIVAGRPTTRWPLADLREQVCLVEQDSPFLGRTLRESLSTGGDLLTDEACRPVLERVGLGHLVAGGLDAVVNQHGTDISGGERQRLAVARAILSGRPICLLDEPTAHLDAHSERAVLDALLAMPAGRVVIMASHSPTVVRAADRVIAVTSARPAPVTA